MNSDSRSGLSETTDSTLDKWFFRFALNLAGWFLPLVNRTNGTLISHGKKRDYLLYVPETYDPAMPTPLVVSLHGFAEWPAHQMQISRWNDLARQHGFIVVYPCGTEIPLRWHTYGLPGNGSAPVDDVTFISDLLDKLESEYHLDPARIYVNGLSNGGGMAFVLGCKLAERFAAIGSVSGAYPFTWNECQPSRAVSAILFHGTSDPIVPFLGGRSGASGISLPSIPDWVAALARYNNCDDKPLELPVKGNVSGIQFANCAADAEIRFYTVSGGGHSWPGGGSMPRIIVGNTNRDIDATKMMWDFFCQHPLPVNRLSGSK